MSVRPLFQAPLTLHLTGVYDGAGRPVLSAMSPEELL